MKKKYLKPELYVIEEVSSELLVSSLGSVNSNLSDDETIVVNEEDVEDGFWGR